MTCTMCPCDKAANLFVRPGKEPCPTHPPHSMLRKDGGGWYCPTHDP